MDNYMYQHIMKRKEKKEKSCLESVINQNRLCINSNSLVHSPLTTLLLAFPNVSHMSTNDISNCITMHSFYISKMITCLVSTDMTNMGKS